MATPKSTAAAIQRKKKKLLTGKHRLRDNRRGKKRPKKVAVPAKRKTRAARKQSASRKKAPLKSLQRGQISLRKPRENPILVPRQDHPWESQQTFNPAAVHVNGKVHLLYRALGEDGISRICVCLFRESRQS